MDPEGGECYVVGDDDAAAAVAAKKKTKTKKRGRQMVCCDKCRLGITTVGEVFTVPCAGGTTGNYVNEGGFVHQTMTLRRVKRGTVYCRGYAQTKDRLEVPTSRSTQL